MGWRIALYLAALATAAVTALGIWLIRDDPAFSAETVEPQAVASRVAWRGLFRNRNLLLLAAGYFTINYFEYIFFYWIYYYFGQIRGMSVQSSAVYTTVLSLSMMAGTPLGGWLCDRLTLVTGAAKSRQAVAGGGMVLSAVCLYAGTMMTSTIPMVAMLSLAIGLAAAAEGPFWSAAIETGGSNVGVSCGIMNGVGNVGGLLAPVLTPWIAQMAGWSVSLHFASALILFGASTWLLNRPRAAE